MVGRGIRKSPHWSEGRKGKTDSGTGMRKAWNGMENGCSEARVQPRSPSGLGRLRGDLLSTGPYYQVHVVMVKEKLN